ncbi:MAG: signal peptidase I, partial [Acidobacteria bacterium]|nr:signal peptidase I [Acidobacteriota bacterium]
IPPVRRAEPPVRRPTHSRWPWIHWMLASFLLLTFLIQLTYVDGSSMASTLHSGDRLFIDKVSPHVSELDRGEIIVFTATNGKDEQYIKRVIALPGEWVEIRSGIVYVNNRAIQEFYVTLPDHTSFPQMRVPEDHLFVLGDNRINSEDSRVWGFVPMKNVMGIARFRFWPPERVGTL